MEPNRNYNPLDQSFDMSKMAAAMPPQADPRYYQNQQPQSQPQPQPFIHGLGLSSPAFYPPPQEVQRPNMASMPHPLTGTDMGWRQPQPEMDNNSGILRSREYSWGVLPLQQLPTLVGSSSSSFGPPGAARSGVPPQQTREVRRRSVPSSPRGPPRKPKRSGYALWVGNLHPSTRIGELKDHFSAGARQDIDSVFLISKSNCAFVNYGTEIACVAAMNRFHNSRLRGRALVCRLRKTASVAQSPALPTTSPSELSTPPEGQPSSPVVIESPPSPLIVGKKIEVAVEDADQVGSPEIVDDDSSRTKIPEKFFILKSLTLEDLESSLTTRTWATQPHNESVLNQAYDESTNVYLIFSANKSGEYFGCARMASPATPASARSSSQGARDVSATPLVDGVDEDSPRMVFTPGTNTAPKGWIIDDSARGSIFWEADHAEISDENVEVDGLTRESSGSGQFTIEWLSTTKLPFYQTRGMRNSFNGNREIKIARDGQELDPRVGRRLLQLFRASAGSGLVDGVR